MSDICSDIQWMVATPAEKAILTVRRYWPYLAILLGASIMMAVQIWIWGHKGWGIGL